MKNLKIVALSATTPTNLINLIVKVELVDNHGGNVFSVNISSPQLLTSYEDSHQGNFYQKTNIAGFLIDCDNNGWNRLYNDNREDRWDTDFDSLYQVCDIAEDVQKIITNLVREFKSYYRSKRADYLLKAEWLEEVDLVSLAEEIFTAEEVVE